jgi:hypothetical protein
MQELTGRQLVGRSFALLLCSSSFIIRFFLLSSSLLICFLLLSLQRLLVCLVVVLFLLFSSSERRPLLILVAPTEVSIRTVRVEPIPDLELAVKLLVVGEDAEVVGEEGADNGGNPEAEDDLLLDSDGDVTDAIVTSGDGVFLVQEVEVDSVPGRNQCNRDDEQNSRGLQGNAGSISVLGSQ